MCNPLAIVGSAISAAGQIKEGRQAREFGNYQQAQAQADAQAVIGQSQVQAGLIRKNAQQVNQSATAAFAASGADLTSGTLSEISRANIEAGETDAFLALLEGQDNARRLREGGRVAMEQGYQASRASQIGALGTLVGTASNQYANKQNRMRKLSK